MQRKSLYPLVLFLLFSFGGTIALFRQEVDSESSRRLRSFDVNPATEEALRHVIPSAMEKAARIGAPVESEKKPRGKRLTLR